MTQITPPAIFFHPDAIETQGKDIVGRRSAGQSFLKGFLTHVGGDHVSVVTQTDAAAKTFETVARQLGETREIRASTLRGQKGFTDAGAIFFPAPGYMDAAWRRQRFNPAACSLIGITHTVSTRRVIEGMHTLLGEPVEQGIAANTAPIDVKPHQQASVAASVGQQISAAIGHKPDGVTEISLNPEELGRVRFSMKTHEGSVVLIIAAERAETQDLMRKNIESLSQEFKSLGFTDIGFQFQGHGQSRERDNNTGTTIVSDQVPEPAIEIADSENEQIGEDGLDLRL